MFFAYYFFRFISHINRLSTTVYFTNLVVKHLRTNKKMTILLRLRKDCPIGMTSGGTINVASRRGCNISQSYKVKILSTDFSLSLVQYTLLLLQKHAAITINNQNLYFKVIWFHNYGLVSSRRSLIFFTANKNFQTRVLR